MPEREDDIPDQVIGAPVARTIDDARLAGCATAPIASLIGMPCCAPAFGQLKAAASHPTSSALSSDDFSSSITGAAVYPGRVIHPHGFIREFL